MKLFALFICFTFCYSNAYIANTPVTLKANRHLFRGGVTEYFFYDGEPVTFICYRNSGNFVELSLFNGTLTTKLQTALYVQIYLKLEADMYNWPLVVCTTWNQQKTHMLKTVLQLIRKNPEYDKVLGFQVNGLILPVIEDRDGNYLYEYNYYHNYRGPHNEHVEPLSIRIIKDNRYHEVIYCRASGPNPPVSIINRFNGNNKEPFTNLSTTLYHGNSGTVLYCPVTYIAGDANRPSQSISLRLNVWTADYYPFINGLSMANILRKLITPYGTIIWYQFVTRHRLYITCEYGDSPIKWNYDASELITGKDEHGHINWFELASHVEHSFIQCTSPHATVKTYLRLVRKQKADTTTAINPNDDFSNDNPPGTGGQSILQEQETIQGLHHTAPTPIPADVPTPNPADALTPIPADAPTPIPGYNSNNDGTTSNLPDNTMLFVAVVVVAVVIVGIIVFLGAHLRKRRQRALYTSANTLYVNLPEHNEGPMATPAQWDRHESPTYAVPDTKDLYATPIPKSNRPTEPAYMEPQGSACKFEDAPGRKNEYQNYDPSNMIYAEVAPEASRGDRVTLNAKNDNYAQISHEKPVESNYANVPILNK